LLQQTDVVVSGAASNKAEVVAVVCPCPRLWNAVANKPTNSDISKSFVLWMNATAIFPSILSGTRYNDHVPKLLSALQVAFTFPSW
jgi:hypothetical protein